MHSRNYSVLNLSREVCHLYLEARWIQLLSACTVLPSLSAPRCLLPVSFDRLFFDRNLRKTSPSDVPTSIRWLEQQADLHSTTTGKREIPNVRRVGQSSINESGTCRSSLSLRNGNLENRGCFLTNVSIAHAFTEDYFAKSSAMVMPLEHCLN
jgi:hypothetical protein